jgi:hypothetical protein
MKNKYIYTAVMKDTGTPIQDIAYSREEAREVKRLYEAMYQGKVQILRYENPAKIR